MEKGEMCFVQACKKMMVMIVACAPDSFNFLI